MICTKKNGMLANDEVDNKMNGYQSLNREDSK